MRNLLFLPLLFCLSQNALASGAIDLKRFAGTYEGSGTLLEGDDTDKIDTRTPCRKLTVEVRWQQTERGNAYLDVDASCPSITDDRFSSWRWTTFDESALIDGTTDQFTWGGGVNEGEAYVRHTLNFVTSVGGVVGLKLNMKEWPEDRDWVTILNAQNLKRK